MANFKVIKIDPEGSGMDWAGHLGYLVDGLRCCSNCSVIFHSDGNFGPFIQGELESLDDEAELMLLDIGWDEEISKKNHETKWVVVESSQFQAAWKKSNQITMVAIMKKGVMLRLEEPGTDPHTCSLEEFLKANSECLHKVEVEQLCELEVGEYVLLGGGCTPQVIVRRVK